MAYAVVCLVALLAAALTLISGFGLGTLLMPAMALVFPAHVAVAGTAVVHLANNLFKLVLVGRGAHRATVLRFALPATVAALGGSWLLARLSHAAPLAVYSLAGRACEITPLGLAVSILIAAFAVLELTPRFERWTVAPRYVPLGGLASGFLGGLSGHQGALRSAFLLRAGLSKEQFIGTGVVCAVVVDVARLSVYGVMVLPGAWGTLGDGGAPGLLAAACVCAFVGSFAGARLMKKITLRAVRGVVGAMLLLVAIAMGAGVI